MTVELQKKLAKNEQLAAAGADVESESEDEEHVHGENCNHDGQAFAHISNRNEKKAREILSKLGWKPIQGIERVTLKRSKNMIFAINAPEVYKIGDSYIVFGEAKMEDPAMQAAAFANQRMQNQRGAEAAPSKGASGPAPTKEDEEVDASGLDEKDIKLVMEQGNCGRAKAVQTLRSTKGDIVSAIMELSL